MNNSEKQRLRNYQNMAPPSELLQEFNELNRKNKDLQHRLLSQQRQYSVLRDVKMSFLNNDLDFFNTKIERQESRKLELLNDIKNTQGAVANFNQSLNNFLSERIVSKNYVPFGLPVFLRGHVFKQEPASGKSLIVDIAHPVQGSLVAVSGEIVSKGKGSVQFVILHKELDKWKVIPAGEEFAIRDEDEIPKAPGVYSKNMTFSSNYVQVEKGDRYGLVIENSVEITFDAVGTSSSIVIPLEKEALPEFLELPRQDDMVQLKASGNNDEWKKYALPRNEGKAFSFNLMGGVVE